MSLKLYLRKEVLGFHFKGPGFWFPLFVGCVCAMWIGFLDDEHACLLVKDLVSILPTWSVVVLGLIVASVTFQLGTFSVEDLRTFAEDEQGREYFCLIRGAMLWNCLSALVLTITAFVMKLAGNSISSLSQVALAIVGGFAGFVGGYLTLSLWCAIVASHDHANWKLVLAGRGDTRETTDVARPERRPPECGDTEEESHDGLAQ